MPGCQDDDFAAGPGPARGGCRPPGPAPSGEELESLIAGLGPKLLAWDMDVFAVHRDSRGHSLMVVTLALLRRFGLLGPEGLVDEPVAAAYLLAVEARYEANPYHNSLHAADVTQACAVMLRLVDECAPVSPAEALAVLLAAAVHDLGHLAVNNDFLVNTRDARALTYNDLSVNENYHAASAFQLALSSPALNIFGRLATAEFKAVRQLVVGLVLATDMSVHFGLLEDFGRAAAAQPDPSQWKDRALLFRMLLHLADIANPARRFAFARAWAERVVAEFLQQGDREAAAGLPVTPFCNRATVNMPRAQMGFIGMFLQPTLAAFSAVVPAFGALALPLAEAAVASWSALEAAGVRAPDEGLDDYSPPE